MKVADGFAGIGGSSEGAKMAGAEIVWTGNHWQEAVAIHARNHPQAMHTCQDMHQVNPALIPQHDIFLASPCCQGHSPARGKANGNPQHDSSRATAWSILSIAEYHKEDVIIVENVPAFTKWALYPAWRQALHALGYAISPYIIDAADHGVPQNRERLYLVMTRSKHPIELTLPHRPHVGADSFIDFSHGSWSKIDRPGRSAATLSRIAAGRRRFGDRFLAPYYGTGSGQTGRDIARPIGTITTRDRWAVIDGDRMRMLTKHECAAAMGFRPDYILPEQHTLAVHMIGNAVCPVVMCDLINSIKEAA
ncbi:DNA cytosine methyltransferase [Aquitalea magnusonii]|uniref:DNA (cytosine-5-)-methyltransferase n=1 Tax=Aquitalea magnusonii TaxID=332411 RepID=A0A318JL66_9NEIS|nr:DNA cytosine methyltransferase [Aquitalea magnusonii]PXX49025.1 DNA (cytosine-5)-methyltransferase 1 [Aquitalea magnusonii]